MSTKPMRDYSCKDEELTVIAKFVAQSYRRDLLDFNAFSPRFTDEYGRIFDNKIDAATQLIAPESDTIELTHATAQITSDSEELKIKVNKIEAYRMLSKQIQLSTSNFGITDVRKSLNGRDTESKLNTLGILNQNIIKYFSQLEAEGMSQELYKSFIALVQSIDEHKQLQYKIISQRRLHVQENIETLNDLYAAMNEILNIGKALYKKQNPAKERDYNFTELKKRVHSTSKTEEVDKEDIK